MGDLAGRVVWVTGASSGIGADLARELGRRGARLALTARRAEALEDVARASGGGMVVPADVTDRDAMLAAGERIRADLGPVDVAVMNAGTYEPVDPDTFGDAVVRRHLEVNVMGTVHGIEAVMPDMRRRRSGRIAVVTSLTGYAPLPRAAAYGASKAFLISMCDSLRADLVRDGVGVTVIAPGFVHTPLTAQNDFEMPFVISSEEAARIICDGLAAGDDHIAFPLRLAALLRTLSVLPGPLRRRWTARLAARRATPGEPR